MSTYSRHSSQTLPENWDKGAVTVLVASNFHSIAYDRQKHVLVKFYAPWCGQCRLMAPMYNQLGKMYRHREDIVIAKYDGSKNELPVYITGYPTLKLFRKGDNRVIDYTGPRKLRNLMAFINYFDQSEQSSLNVDDSRSRQSSDSRSRDNGCKGCIII
ncbi:hypothetical protein O3M35_011129 [Rhynocoris fuscipes]|uniref:protein disulfide-isomerase n=1 Tax=Rhynocoris fuscipes TaxID=488301 RepID=A0AAW1CUM5_9HEMI